MESKRSTSEKDKAVLHVRRVARRIDPEPGHAFQVCKNALALFDATSGLHKLSAADRRLLESAALLHDTGHTIEFSRHHKHSRDLIMDMELPGFTRRERRIIACVARYHRKAHPDAKHAVYCDLSRIERRRVEKLAAILRIADGLDRCHAASCRQIRATTSKTKVAIEVQQRQPSPVDIWGAQRKQKLFEEVFGVTVTIGAVADTQSLTRARTSTQ